MDEPRPCALCPRRCPDRAEGLCGERDFTHAHVAKTMLHRWEEPCVSGERGSGAVFFAGCNLRCLFCQNHKISAARPLPGEHVDAARLCEIFWELHKQGAENINLVSPSHVLPVARRAILLAKSQGFPLPFVWNSNGYESVRALRSLDGLIDLYLPDLKYADNCLALVYSGAPAYFRYASAALLEMRRQGDVLVRHLVVPGGRKDALKVLDWIAENLPGARVSLMSQYTPMYRAQERPPLNRKITGFEYQSVVDHALSLGLTDCYVQRREAAGEGYTPEF